MTLQVFIKMVLLVSVLLFLIPILLFAFADLIRASNARSAKVYKDYDNLWTESDTYKAHREGHLGRPQRARLSLRHLKPQLLFRRRPPPYKREDL